MKKVLSWLNDSLEEFLMVASLLLMTFPFLQAGAVTEEKPILLRPA